MATALKLSKKFSSVPSERPKPWECQEGEPAKQYHAFTHYRDLPREKRSARLAWYRHKVVCQGVSMTTEPKGPPPKRWAIWSVEWGWVERAEAHDAELERQIREKLIADQIAARKRHAVQAADMLATFEVPVKALLKALTESTTLVTQLTEAMKDPAAAMQALGAITRIAAVLPGVVNVERIALGLAEDAIDVEASREPDPMAAKIVSDPEATALAIQLLGRIAGVPASPPTGPLALPSAVNE